MNKACAKPIALGDEPRGANSTNTSHPLTSAILDTSNSAALSVQAETNAHNRRQDCGAANIELRATRTRKTTWPPNSVRVGNPTLMSQHLPAARARMQREQRSQRNKEGIHNNGDGS